ncbi:MAG: hypothetical protein WCF90_02935 [Methanomicrobiales archaeon]
MLKQEKANPPSLILIDILLIPIEGWELLDKLLGEYGLKDMSGLLFTASLSVEEKIAELNYSRVRVLQKPVFIIELKTGLEIFFGEITDFLSSITMVVRKGEGIFFVHSSM